MKHNEVWKLEIIKTQYSDKWKCLAAPSTAGSSNNLAQLLPSLVIICQPRGTKKGSEVSNGNSNEAAVIMKTAYSPNVDIAQRPAASFVNSPVAATQVGLLRRVMFRTVQRF